MTLLSLDVEWGVRYQLPGEDEQTEAVGSEFDAANLIHDLWLQYGVTGERIGRHVGPWEAM